MPELLADNYKSYPSVGARLDHALIKWHLFHWCEVGNFSLFINKFDGVMPIHPYHFLSNSCGTSRQSQQRLICTLCSLVATEG